MGLIDELPAIPDKLSFKIGDVARLVGVEPHVLRYWETEFPRMRPRKSPSGHRLYTRTEIDRLRRIRCLLHERGFTVAGARSLLREGDEAVGLALAPRPSELSQVADHARARAESLEADLDLVQRRASEAAQRAEHAESEARFWRVAANEAESRLALLRATIEETTRRWIMADKDD